MIGDSSADSSDPRDFTYSNYFKSCCSLSLTSIEEKFCEHLINQGLGAPFSCNRTGKEILHALTSYQGGFTQGAGGDAYTDVVDSIYSMIKPARELSETIDRNDGNTVIISKSELDILRSQKLELEKLLNALTGNTGGSSMMKLDDKKTFPYNNQSEVYFISRGLTYYDRVLLK